MFKKIVFVLICMSNLVDGEDKIELTFEEMEELVKPFDTYLNKKIHTEKGLKILLACVNTPDKCAHVGLINVEDQPGYIRLNELIKNEMLDVQLNVKNQFISVYYKDVYHIDINILNEIFIRTQTRMLLNYLLGCLQYKKRILKN